MAANAPNPLAPLTVRDFQTLIRERYLATDAARGAAATFLLFTEEVGELATAIHAELSAAQRADRDNLAAEFADVLAWLTTLANILEVDLEQALGKYTGPDAVKGVKP